MSYEDKATIRSCVELYGYAVDSLRWDLFDRIFVRDGLYVRHGDREPWSDYDKFVDDFAAYHKIFTSTQHSMTNMICEVDGDAAKAITYGNWRLVRLGAEGGDTWMGQGWYEDAFVRTEAGWRIQRRQSRQVWREGNDNIGVTTGVEWKHATSSLQNSDFSKSMKISHA
ncbi:hypothetical protein Sphch_3222 [Sphingobium chlorophenolicum L-1]|uniref:SnoaL-like domain-containing protein n=1 Tax=Sphingobium chlorophenolicum L-1 TaxID=690566 RepID=F6F321_SPHCR|nr:nuclear transport factor 2 family protein [Sphingobium chlorophenolicum]AEG50833.1 hypothetical protein Sphch_3222 [Sphingobium chlorophenolicum L-1]